MKKILTILTMLFLAIISGCSSEESQKEVMKTTDNNSKTLENNQIVQSNFSKTTDFENNLNEIKFNSNLTEYEEKYLRYYEEKFPTSKIYFMKTQLYKCTGCYDIYYKKDREILKIKISNYKIVQETTIKSEFNLYIENPTMCTLFQGKWNECPKVCPTDEEICVASCGTPTCEFDSNKIVLKKESEICGGLKNADCEFGFTCSYKSKNDESGICIKK